MNPILNYTLSFCIVDRLLTHFNVAGSYYLLHFIANSYIVVNTFEHVLLCYTNLYGHLHIPVVSECMDMTVALHLYHIIVYKSKFRLDDWLHHIIMVFLALPLTSVFTSCGIVVSHALFFTTGLPGGIDYLLLFLSRNNILITRVVEKRVNIFLNIWIRCPGCIVTASFVLILMQLHLNFISYTQLFASGCIMGVLYWNGIYFMHGVLKDYYTNHSVKL